MNIFYVPSWYPSKNNPIYGTFIKEQINLLGEANPDWNLGISTWGQGDPQYMLWVKDHLFNALKLGNGNVKPFQKKINDNIEVFFSPCLTWTRRIARGNLNGLIKSNEYNFNQFKSKVGNIDIIHAQATYPGALIAQHLSEKYNIPYVVTIRMSPFPFHEFLRKDGTIQSWVAKPLKGANQLIATSHSLQRTLVSYGLENVTVVNNPVDTNYFQPADNQVNGLRILSIGRLESQKGYDILIHAIAQLKEKFHGTVRIGGDGSQYKVLQALAKQLGVDYKLEWLGELSREEVLDEMQQCSFYVLSSRHETFGNVLLEAMACGKPVVSTRCGGPLDIVSDQVGILCEPNDPNDLASAIEQMIEKQSEYSSEKIRQHVMDKFSPERFSEQMTVVYQDAISHFAQ